MANNSHETSSIFNRFVIFNNWPSEHHDFHIFGHFGNFPLEKSLIGFLFTRKFDFISVLEFFVNINLNYSGKKKVDGITAC